MRALKSSLWRIGGRGERGQLEYHTEIKKWSHSSAQGVHGSRGRNGMKRTFRKTGNLVDALSREASVRNTFKDKVISSI